MTAENRFLQSLPASLRGTVGQRVSLSDLTTLRVGGPAALVCPALTPEDARRFQSAAEEAGLPQFVLGGGSNILADDRGFGGVILRLAGQQRIFRGDTVRAAAGIGFDDLIRQSLDAGLTGFEFASGIPGTLGGALVGNAGCYGHELGEFLLEATVLLPDGRLERMGPANFGFRYRGTALRDSGAILLEALFQLHRGDVAEAAETRQRHLEDRRRKHPVTEPSAGSWFRNIEPSEPGGRRRAAGTLLDEVGAKAMREGEAGVFPKHANIIVNLGAATSDDVRRLAARMKQAVHERYGVELHEEVRYLADALPPAT